jgi:hypothetical protein
MHPVTSPRTPADLLQLGHDPALCRLLRACGTDEACVTGRASDYDQFLALAAALPLCEGHPLQEEINAKLAASTGLSAPLCPHTARSLWDAWVETHWYGNDVKDTTYPMPCPLCTPSAPILLREADLTRLPRPAAVKAPDLAAWSAVLEASIPADGTLALLVLPVGYVFTRPNPYHAGVAVGKVHRGEGLTPAEGDLLLTQALRVWGLALTRRGDAPRLILRGGDPAAVTALCAYLAVSKALPAMTWIPDDPTHAEALCGLYDSVETGHALPEGVSVGEAANIRAAYAAVAPIGRAVILQ